jgi:hypothetical protein
MLPVDSMKGMDEMPQKAMSPKRGESSPEFDGYRSFECSAERKGEVHLAHDTILDDMVCSEIYFVHRILTPRLNGSSW